MVKGLSFQVGTSLGKTGVRTSPLSSIQYSLLNHPDACTVDAANEAAVSGFTIPKGTPGAGTGVKHKMVYISTKSINILGMQYRNKVTTAKDSLENFKELGFTA